MLLTEQYVHLQTERFSWLVTSGHNVQLTKRATQITTISYQKLPKI